MNKKDQMADYFDLYFELVKNKGNMYQADYIDLKYDVKNAIKKLSNEIVEGE